MSVRVGDELVAGGQGDMYTKAQVDALIANAIAQTTEKPGMIKPFAGTTVPTGYLLCDGSAVSRTTYADLFTAIGTTYGSGDGSTTFNLPDTTDRVLWSTGVWSLGSKYSAGLPQISGSIRLGGSYGFDAFDYASGAFALGTTHNTWQANTLKQNESTKMQDVVFYASASNSIYGSSSTVRPPCIVFNFIIKY